MLALSAQARAQSPVVLACQLPAARAAGTPAAAPTERFFRVAPGTFQEWDAAQGRFGTNLCAAYTCAKMADRSEGTIGSASVTYTVGIVHATGEGYWRATGASDLATDHGSCRVATAPQGARP
jgi:hypothetical protein